MILEDESQEIKKLANEETTNSLNPEKNLSKDAIKSRKVAMNVESDTKKHPKSYYVNFYNQSINGPSHQANHEISSRMKKNIRTKGNNIRENYIKIKRKRLDKEIAEKYDKVENNQGNPNGRFYVSNHNSNLKSSDKSSMFDSDTKSKFKSIKVSKISFPALNDQIVSDEDHKKEIKVDRENLFEIHELNENEYENVRQIGQSSEREDKNAPATKDYEALRKLSDNLMKLITLNNGGINPLATKYEEIIESTKPMTPKENVTWSSRKDVSRALSGNLNNEIENNDNNSNFNNRINNNNTNDSERKIPNTLEQQHQINFKKGLNSKYSSRSEALPIHNNLNNFKAPRSSNSMIVIKPAQANSNSSNSLRRIQLRESIKKITLNNEHERNECNNNQATNIESVNLISDSHSITYEITVKLGHYLIIFFIGTALAIGYYYAFTKGVEFLGEHPDILQNLSDVKGITIIISILALTFLLTYLIRRNKQISRKHNQLVAYNCFNGIKSNLLSKRESGIPSPEIDSCEFSQVYCSSNNVKPAYFKQTIIPLIRENCKSDDSVEESNTYVDGVIKTMWRLKSSNYTQ